MSGWLKQFLFGIWGLLLIPLIMPAFKIWLDENVFSDPGAMATTAFRHRWSRTAFDNLVALGRQLWFKFALVFLTGIVLASHWNGVSHNSKKGELPSFEVSATSSAVFRTASEFELHRPDGLDNARYSQPAILSALISARKFICGCRTSTSNNCRMRHSSANTSDVSEGYLEDGEFDKASREALSWKPFLDNVKLS